MSNPPYISSFGFNRDTSRSVRNWEPKLALVPPTMAKEDLNGVHPADVFYPRILEASKGAKVVVMEVADLEQAKRVARLAIGKWKIVEIWRDWPTFDAEEGEELSILIEDQMVAVKGTGHGRSVVCWS